MKARSIRILWLTVFTLGLCVPGVCEVVKVDTLILSEIQRTAGKKGLLGDVKVPKDSRMYKFTGWESVNATFYFPRARAAEFAAYAKENFISLDSTNWCPGIFNEGVLVDLKPIGGDMTNVVRLDRIACVLPNDSLVGPLWVALDTVQVSNLAGATLTGVNLRAMYPLSVFNGNQDLRFFVFSGGQRSDEMKISAKDMAKQR